MPKEVPQGNETAERSLNVMMGEGAPKNLVYLFGRCSPTSAKKSLFTEPPHSAPASSSMHKARSNKSRTSKPAPRRREEKRKEIEQQGNKEAEQSVSSSYPSPVNSVHKLHCNKSGQPVTTDSMSDTRKPVRRRRLHSYQQPSSTAAVTHQVRLLIPYPLHSH